MAGSIVSQEATVTILIQSVTCQIKSIQQLTFAGTWLPKKGLSRVSVSPDFPYGEETEFTLSYNQQLLLSDEVHSAYFDNTSAYTEYKLASQKKQEARQESKISPSYIKYCLIPSDRFIPSHH